MLILITIGTNAVCCENGKEPSGSEIIGSSLTSCETVRFSITTQLHLASFLPQPFSNCSSVRFFVFYTFPTSRVTKKCNHMTDNTAWPHTHVAHVAAPTDIQVQSTVAVLHRKIAARPNTVDVDSCPSESLRTAKTMLLTFCPGLPDIQKSTAFWNVTRFRRLLLLKPKISLQVWWNDTEKAKPKYWGQQQSQCHLSTTNLARFGLGSKRRVSEKMSMSDSTA